jgi:succinyl-CoA synthetase beta subunit
MAFMATGASLAEINPLVVTPNGEVMALDAKISVDDNELDRLPKIAALRDESPRSRARSWRATRTSRSSSSMATSAACERSGTRHGDDGPGEVLWRRAGELSRHWRLVQSREGRERPQIITADPNVKAILFNIFGGITRTDDVANGIVTATKQNPLKVPIVIRLTGTNEEIAVKILTENGFSAMTDMDEAVQRAVKLATGGQPRECLHRQEHDGHRPGHHGARRFVPHAPDDRIRHAVVGWRHAGKGGQKFDDKVPIFNTVAEAAKETGANTSVITCRRCTPRTR